MVMEFVCAGSIDAQKEESSFYPALFFQYDLQDRADWELSIKIASQ